MNEEQIRGIVSEEIERVLGSYSNITNEMENAMRTRISSNIIVAKITIDMASAASQNSSTQTVTVYGATPGDAVLLTPPAGGLPGNLGGIYAAYVSASNTVTIRFINPDTGSSLDPGAAEYTIVIIKP